MYNEACPSRQNALTNDHKLSEIFEKLVVYGLTDEKYRMSVINYARATSVVVK